MIVTTRLKIDTVRCKECRGRGSRFSIPCVSCSGKGYIVHDYSDKEFVSESKQEINPLRRESVRKKLADLFRERRADQRCTQCGNPAESGSKCNRCKELNKSTRQRNR